MFVVMGIPGVSSRRGALSASRKATVWSVTNLFQSRLRAGRNGSPWGAGDWICSQSE